MANKVNFQKTARCVDFYVLLFFLLSFLGWIWEVGLYLITTHQLVNCGVYRGPYLPIYGTGGLLLWFILQRFRHRPGVVFVLSAAISTALEYTGSVFLEHCFGHRWWDYTKYPLDFQGRICPLASCFFGLFGMLLICLFMPSYMRLYHKIPAKIRWFICIMLSGIFLVDVAYCAVDPNLNIGKINDVW